MPITLRVLLIVFALLLFVVTTRLIAKGRLQIKYSLLWMLLSLVVLLVAVFPHIVYALAYACGFRTPSNFALVVGVVLLLGISMMLSVIVSWQARTIRSLVQSVALLKHDIEELRGGEADE